MLSQKIRDEEKRMFRSMLIPLLMVVIMWAVKIIEYVGGYDFYMLGIYPQRWQSLVGIITTPFIHGSFRHLLANTVPILVLGSALFYFYPEIAWKIFLWIWLFTGFWVWVSARPAYHIGASGIVYGLSAFIFFSGIFRRHVGLMAIALIVVFLYGSLIWGIFPEFFPKENISWESHLFGLLAGLLLAFYYRKEGPQRKRYDWEFEEDEDDDDGDDDHAYWKSTIS